LSPAWVKRSVCGTPARTDNDFRFLAACRRGDIAEVRRTYDAGARLEVEDKACAQGIHWACQSGHLLVLEWLYERGVPLDAQTQGGAQPIHWACYSGQLAIVRWLHQRGVRLDVEDSHGQQPMHWANRAGQFATARWLHDQYLQSNDFSDASSEHSGPLSLMRWIDSEPAALCLRWEKVRNSRAPRAGRELIHEELLSLLLQGQTRFSSTEAVRLRITSVTEDSYIRFNGQGGSGYFRPAPRVNTAR